MQKLNKIPISFSVNAVCWNIVLFICLCIVTTTEFWSFQRGGLSTIVHFSNPFSPNICITCFIQRYICKYDQKEVWKVLVHLWNAATEKWPNLSLLAGCWETQEETTARQLRRERDHHRPGSKTTQSLTEHPPGVKPQRASHGEDGGGGGWRGAHWELAPGWGARQLVFVLRRLCTIVCRDTVACLWRHRLCAPVLTSLRHAHMAAALTGSRTGPGESWPTTPSLLLLLFFLPPTQVAATAHRHPASEEVAFSRDVGRTPPSPGWRWSWRWIRWILGFWLPRVETQPCAVLSFFHASHSASLHFARGQAHPGAAAAHTVCHSSFSLWPASCAREDTGRCGCPWDKVALAGQCTLCRFPYLWGVHRWWVLDPVGCPLLWQVSGPWWIPFPWRPRAAGGTTWTT